jgi:hypothetical protein
VSGDVIGDLIGDNMVEGEVKQEGGSVDAWCVPMSQRRNRGTLMAVRRRVEGRGSVFKECLRDKWIGPGTQRQIMALKVGFPGHGPG